MCPSWYRWKWGVSLVSNVLGEAIGKLYVEKYFPEANKKRMLELVHNLQTALGERISEATWMSAQTKAQAKDKLANFIIKIGYPDKWKDYSGLQVNSYPAYKEWALNLLLKWAEQDPVSEKEINRKSKSSSTPWSSASIPTRPLRLSARHTA